MKCDKCGICCKTSYVNFFNDEFDRLIKEFPQFKDKATHYGYIWVFWEGCPFIDDKNKCLIYKYRPHYCKAFPLIMGMDGRVKLSSECNNWDSLTDQDIKIGKRMIYIATTVLRSKLEQYRAEVGEGKFREMLEKHKKGYDNWDDTHSNNEVVRFYDLEAIQAKKKKQDSKII